MSERKVKVGVIGTGAIAQIAYFPVLSAMQHVEISAVYSKTFENAKRNAQRFGAKKVCCAFEDFLDTDLDCAVLLTPKTVRGDYIPALLERKLDVLCEKPLAMTLHECDEFANLAEKTSQLLMVSFNRRFAPANIKAIGAFKTKKPHMMLANKSREFKEFRGTLENAIHMVDLLRYVLGECVELTARASFSNPMFEDACSVLLGFDQGGTGLLAASREAGQWREHVEIYGENITAISDNLDSCRIISSQREEVYNYTPLNKGWSTVVNKLGFEGCIKHFINCVQTRNQPLTNAVDAFKTHELMDKILRTAGLPDLSRHWEEEALFNH